MQRVRMVIDTETKFHSLLVSTGWEPHELSRVIFAAAVKALPPDRLHLPFHFEYKEGVNQ
ncbi:MAG: hypothetical protein AB1705_27405 [Verrucomicrobiota bacterium]